MLGNLIYIESDSPEVQRVGLKHFEHLYLDGKKKQFRQEEMRRQKLLAEYTEELQFENQKQRPAYSSKNATDFYERNKQWQQMVQQKNYSQRQQNLDNRSHTPTISAYKIDNYKGPIKGWQSRFEDHINKKMNQTTYNENSFRPSINKKSEEICSKIFSDEPVEERLIKYGLDVKNKRDFVKQQVNFYQNMEIQQTFFKPQVNENQSGDDRPFYDRLYEYAAVYEQRKLEQLEQYDQLERVPATVQLPKDVEERVNNYRQSHPLYEVKDQPNEMNELNEQKRLLSAGELDDFLKRNYILNGKQKSENFISKEDEELRECSFKPYINPISKELVKDGNVVERNQKQMEKRNKQMEEYRRQVEEDRMKECSFKPSRGLDPAQWRKQQEIDINSKKRKQAERYKEARKQPYKVPELFEEKESGRQLQFNGKQSPKKKEKQKVKFGEGPETLKSSSSFNQGLYNLNSLLRKSETNHLEGPLNSQFERVEKQIENLFECIEQNK